MGKQLVDATGLAGQVHTRARGALPPLHRLVPHSASPAHLITIATPNNNSLGPAAAGALGHRRQLVARLRLPAPLRGQQHHSIMLLTAIIIFFSAAHYTA